MGNPCRFRPPFKQLILKGFGFNHNLKPTVTNCWREVKSISHRSSMAVLYQIFVCHLPKQTSLPSLLFNHRNGPLKIIKQKLD